MCVACQQHVKNIAFYGGEEGAGGGAGGGGVGA